MTTLVSRPSVAVGVLSRRERIVLHATAAATCALILAPLVLPGYVLSYDMVFVPHQALTWELVAPSAGLPRAVPEDLVVSLLSLAVPGWLLQRVALAGIVYAAALGAGRLVPARRLWARVVAAVGYAWSPFLAERLLLGQWGLLLVYAALPWLVAGALRLRGGQPGGLARVVLAAAVCALTPTGGVIAFVTTAALSAGRSRRWLPAVCLVAVLNLPWLLTALTAQASGLSDPAGVPAFAARAENWGGVVVALAGTGGAWNAQTMPASRTSAAVPFVTLALLLLALYGCGRLRHRWPVGGGTAMLGLAVGSLLVAGLGALPGTAAVLEWAVRSVPGAGLFRDGQKFLIPYALALVLAVALGAERLADRLASPTRARLVLTAVAVLPVVALPDLAFGALGTLRPVSYPADWDHVAAVVQQDRETVLVLPFNEYRSFAWNNRRTVLDPAPRYLPAPVFTDDDLIVGTRHISGENPRAAAVRELLGEGAPVSRTGVRWVLVERDAGGSVPPDALTGLRLIYNGESIDLYENPDATPPSMTPTARRWLIVIGDLLAVVVLAGAVASLCGLATPW